MSRPVAFLDATFILAPMAMALREQGVPIKIVYLGHRDGTTMMVHKDSDIRRIEDLRGKTIAVPNRFSNQRLIIFRVLKERGIPMSEVTLREMPPPDMPAALNVRVVDAIISGEPFMAQTEMDGYGRVLFLTKDVWPEFISCVLAVREDTIRRSRPEVQTLVDGIARSGKWLDQSMDHRMQAADFAGKHYYHQDPRLLRFVLSKPPDRVKYTNLALHRQDFEEIAALGIEAGSRSLDDARLSVVAAPSFGSGTLALIGKRTKCETSFDAHNVTSPGTPKTPLNCTQKRVSQSTRFMVSMTAIRSSRSENSDN